MTATVQQTQAQDRVLNLESHTTPKGLTFWHVEDHSLPIVTINFAFRGAGSINDPAGKDGLVQLLSNTLDEGAGDRDAETFQNALQDNAIELSFSSDRDNFTGKLKTLVKHKGLAVELLRDSLHTPRLEPQDVDRMRQANISRIKSSLAQPSWLASRIMNATYFAGHPYARNSGGTISGLQAVTADDLQNFRKQYFTRGSLVIGTAGDISADDMGIILDQIFADLPQGNDNRMSGNDIVTHIIQEKPIAYEKDSPQSVVRMVWPGLDKTDPDYYAYRVMDYILGGGGFSSLLMDRIREQKGLTYGIYSQPTFTNFDNSLYIDSALDPNNIALMLREVDAILADLKSTPRDEQTVADAKSYLIGSLPMRFSSTLALSGTAVRMQLDGRPIDALDKWADQINAVTAQDVQDVAQRIFAQPHATVTVIVGGVPSDVEVEKLTTVPGVE